MCDKVGGMRDFTAAFVATLGLMCNFARAQSTYGTVIATLSDTTGGVISGADVGLHDVGRNIVFHARFSAAGLYDFLNVLPGVYELTAEKPGMTSQRRVFQIQARQAVRVDLTMTVAVHSESVVVSGEVPLLNAENGAVSDSKPSEAMLRLPLNYRASDAGLGPLAATITVPGVARDDRALSTDVLNGAFRGQRSQTIDGISMMDARWGVPAWKSPSAEMISEMNVTSIGNTAEFGPLADVTLVTKSGTNRFHGSGSWYHQNSALDAKQYNAPEKQQKVYHDFAVASGGPVIIPKLYDGRDRTFVFADYEILRFPATNLTQSFVPTAEWRSGDLTRLPGGPVIDPSTGAPFPGNRIPTTGINPVARTLLDDYYPLPNTADPTTDPNFVNLTRGNYFQHQYDIRIDQIVGAKQHIFSRWSQSNSTQEQTYYLPQALTGTYPSRSINVLLGHAFTPLPSMSNEFRFGFNAVQVSENFPLRGADVVAKLGLVGLDLSSVLDAGGFPAFGFSDATDFAGVGKGRESLQSQNLFQVTDTLTWLHGRHIIKAGGDFQRLRTTYVNSQTTGDDFGTFQFLSGTFSGNAFADLMLGLPATSTTASYGPNPYIRGPQTALFAQDTYKIRRDLTLSLGLRWEVHQPMTESIGNLANFNHTTGDVIVPTNTLPPSPGFLASINACPGTVATLPCTSVRAASKAGLPDSLRRTDWRGWAPRAGIAWRPFGARTVIRGGAGVYLQSLVGIAGVAMAGLHSSDIRQFTNVPVGSGALFVLPDVSGGSAPLPNAGTGVLHDGADPMLREPRSYQWGLTLEREIGWNTVARATYNGLQSVGMPLTVDFNQLQASTIPFRASRKPFPSWASLFSLESVGMANYQCFQTEIERRFRSDFFFQASYTYARDLTNMGAGTSGVNPMFGIGSANRYVTDRFNTRLDRGNLPGFRDQSLTVSGLFPIPIGKGRRYGGHLRGWAGGILGGWELSTVTRAASGAHQNVTMPAGWDQSNTNVATRNVVPRPDRIGDGVLQDPNGAQFYDPSAFVRPPKGAGRFGNAGSGILTGPTQFSSAAGAAKTWAVTEWGRMRFEATFTNFLNHPNFRLPNSNIAAPNFGQLLTTIDQRVGQLGARLDW